MEDMNFIQRLVVVTVIDARHEIITEKIVIRNKIKDFASEMVASYGTGICMYWNKAVISNCGSIETGEYMGSIDLESLLE